VLLWLAAARHVGPPAASARPLGSGSARRGAR
jgi:hypothetical protein